MATPRLYKLYPREYSDLLRGAMKAPVVIPCSDAEAAKRYRGILYAFRTTLLNDPTSPDDLTLLAPLIRFQVKDANLIIHRPKLKASLQKVLQNVRKHDASRSEPNADGGTDNAGGT